MLNWNVGGAALGDLPRALGEATECKFRNDDIVILHEMPRTEAGWQNHVFDQLRVLAHRDENQWRGTGVGFSDRAWTVMRKISSENGVWTRLRHLTLGQELWVGSLYIKPDCNQVEHERRVNQHLGCLPATHLPVILGCDLNSPFAWSTLNGQSLQAVARTGKSNQFLTQLASRSIELIPHGEPQVDTPTSQPRQQDRQGRLIDFLAGARVTTRVTRVHVGSHKILGTDHELLTTELLLGRLKGRRRPETKPSVLVVATD